METVTITKKEYAGLKKDSDFLRRLEAAGVDNWDGYSFAFTDEEIAEEDESEEDIYDK